MSDGGAKEFVQNGYLVSGPFYFSYRQFQVLSNELVMPKILLCKAEDKRFPADDFSTLTNGNLSYFVGVTADYSKPDTLLAGDRNLACNPRPARPSCASPAARTTGGPPNCIRSRQHAFPPTVMWKSGTTILSPRSNTIHVRVEFPAEALEALFRQRVEQCLLVREVPAGAPWLTPALARQLAERERARAGRGQDLLGALQQRGAGGCRGGYGLLAGGPTSS